MTALLLANGIGALTLPISLWQFGGGSSRNHFLWLNLLSCSLWAICSGLASQDTAALASLIAGLSSVGQVGVSGLSCPTPVRRGLQAALALGSVLLIFTLAPPATAWAWLALLAFLYMRILETLPHLALRWLVLLSPVAWMAVAWHAGTYTLIPADALSLASALYWLWRHYQAVPLPKTG